MAGKSRHNQDDVIIESLARGECQTAVAKLAGCSVTTVRRRLDDPEIRNRVERFRREMLDAAAGRLGSAVDKAVKTLEGLLTDKTPPAVRLAAAKSVIEHRTDISHARSLDRGTAGCRTGSPSKVSTTKGVGMSLKHRIAKLEKQFPDTSSQPFDIDLDFRVAGKPRSWVQEEEIRRLQAGIADPRAIESQREQWQTLIAKIGPALRSELEADKRRACPECRYPLHDSDGRGGSKCRGCGCPVHVHGDGRVSDARPGAKSQ